MPEIPFWKTSPMARLLVGLVVGIWIAESWIKLTPSICYIFLGLSFGIWICSLLKIGKRSRFIGGLQMVGLAFAGVALVFTHRLDNRPDFAGRFMASKTGWVSQLEESPIEKANSWKAEASLFIKGKDGKLHPLSGRILLYFKKTPDFIPPAIGTQLSLKRSPSTIESSGNPGAFDYKTFCRRKGIYFQSFLSEGQYEIINTGHISKLTVLIETLTFACQNHLKTNIANKK